MNDSNLCVERLTWNHGEFCYVFCMNFGGSLVHLNLELP